MLYEYFPLHFTARAKSGIHLTEFQLAKCNVLSKSMPLRDQCDICSDRKINCSYPKTTTDAAPKTVIVLSFPEHHMQLI